MTKPNLLPNTTIQGDCLEVMKDFPDNSVDSIVTDPPYGLSFMGKHWDYQVPSVEIWRECLRVLKPGGHLLSFAGTRTYHRMAVNIEDAGFEIRDMIAWIYGSGFPKSLDVSKAIQKTQGVELQVVGDNPNHRPQSAKDNTIGDYNPNSPGNAHIRAVTTPEAKQWQGFGTALKPALEPICVARKPLGEKTVAENVLQYGTGGLNIDGGRVSGEYNCDGGTPGFKPSKGWHENSMVRLGVRQTTGRFPANLIHDGSEEVLAVFLDARSGGNYQHGDVNANSCFGIGTDRSGPAYIDSGSASRFFYCAKASKEDRGDGNFHCTVKPTDLMRYLCRLVTPPNGLILDPFGGSGSTGKAAKLEYFNYILIEREPDYCTIAEKRIAAVLTNKKLF